MEKVKITSNYELMQDLTKVYSKLRNGEISNAEAKSTAVIAGRLISSAKVQNDYNRRVHPEKTIPFLED